MCGAGKRIVDTELGAYNLPQEVVGEVDGHLVAEGVALIEFDIAGHIELAGGVDYFDLEQLVIRDEGGDLFVIGFPPVLDLVVFAQKLLFVFVAMVAC